MAWWGKGFALAGAGLTALGLYACNSGCDQEVIDRAVAFIDAHQTCSTDEDCVVIDDFCAEIPGGYCGQLPMSRAGAESAEWQALEGELGDCAPDECTQCLALLIPSCSNGFCNGR
jgi:hypothetical protein